MTAPGGRNNVGTAYVMIRALTKNVKKDILKGVQAGYKDAEKEAGSSGRRAGRRWATGFGEGVRASGALNALNATWRDSERDAATSGRRAGERYARSYNESIRRATPARTPTSRNNAAGGGDDQTAQETAQAATQTANAERRRRSQEQRIQSQIAAANRRRDRQSAASGDGGGGGNRVINVVTRFREDGAGRTLRLGGMIMAMLKGIGALSVAAFAAMAGQAAVGGLLAIIASLSQITGLLLTIPALINAAGLAIGTLKAGFTGIGEALKAGTAAAAASGEEAAAQQKAIAGAMQQRAQAEKGVETAQKNRIRVQEDYTRAVKDATRQIQDLNLNLKGAALDEEDALIAVERAKERLANMPSGSTALDYREAVNSLKQANQSLEQVRLSNSRLADDTADANKKGVQGSDQVVAAKESIKQADEALIESQRALVEANKAVTEAMNQQGAAAKAFDKAMANLSPSAQLMVRTLLGLKEGFKSLRMSIQEKMFAGLSGPVSNLAKVLMPALTSGTEKAATAFNGMFKDVIKAFASPDSVEKFRLVLERSADMIERMRPGIFALVGVWKNLSTVGSEFLGEFADGFTSGAQRLEKWSQNFDNIRGIIRSAITAFRIWWTLLKDIGSMIGSIFKAANESGFMDAILIGVRMLRENLQSLEGKNALSEFFKNAGTALVAVMPIVNSLILGILEVGGQLAKLGVVMAPGLLDFVNGLREAFQNMQPALDVIGPKLRDLFSALGSQGGQLGDTISALVIAFSPYLDIMRILSTTLLPVVLKLLEVMAPVLAALSPAILGLVIAWKLASGAAAAMNAVMRVSTILFGANATAAGRAAVQQRLAAVASKIWAGVMKVLNLVMSNNPIARIVLILAALVGALVLAYKNSETFRKVVDTAWKAIKDAVGAAWDFLKPIFTAIIDWIKEFVSNHLETLKRVWSTVFEGIKIAVGIWWEAVKIYWDFLVAAFNVIATAATWLWKNVIVPVFNGIKDAVALWWDGVQIYWGLLQDAWHVIEVAAMWLWNNVFKPVFEGIKWTVVTFWDGVKVIWGWLTDAWKGIEKAAMWLWHNVIEPVWNGIASAIKGAIDNVISPAWQLFKDGIQGVQDFFGKAVDAIGKIWDGIKKLAAEPINFVIDTVYNKGIVKTWNAIAGLIGMDDKKLGEIPPIKFAQGGVMPGYTPGRDVHNFTSPTGGRLALSGGEAIMRPEWTRAVGGPKAVADMNSKAKRGKNNFADGGVYGLPGGSNISYGGPGFPSWVYGLANSKGVRPSTYAGHQEDSRAEAGYAPNPNRLNRGIDWSGPVAAMDNFARYLFGIAPKTPALEQIIWQNPVTGVKVGWHGRSPDDGSYFASDYSGHTDHVHTRQSGPLAPGMFGGATGTMGGGGILDSVGGFVVSLKDQVVEQLSKPLRAIADKVPTFGTGDYGKMPKALAKTAVNKLVGFAEGKGDEKDKAGGITGTVGKILTGGGAVPIVMGADGNWTSPSPSWAHLMKRESGGNMKIIQGIQDVNSGGNEASGGFQIAKGTWAAYGGTRFAPTAGEATPQQQAMIAAAIFRKEGGSPWGSGLPGREDDAGLAAGLATKYDTGGKLKPGKTTVINKTGKPEAVLTKQQWDVAKQGLNQAEGKKYLTTTDFRSQAMSWGQDAVKEITGQFTDPVGLSGLSGQGIDALFKLMSDRFAKEDAANAAAAANGGKIAETVIFNGMDPKKVTEEVNRNQNQRGNSYTSRYTNG